VCTIAPGHHQAKGVMPLTKAITPTTIGGNFTSVDHCAKIQTKPLHHPAMPDLPFPKFDGSNPKLWLNNCLSFFDVYEVDPSLWIRYSTMHLSGSAALWFQTVQSTIYNMPWEDFCAIVCAKFDRDEHNHLLRQFFRIHQKDYVHEYIENFCDLIHQLLAHDPTIPLSVITNRFVDGLKKEIKSVVMMHRPQDLDSASALALL
jgi:hypothetical protein